MGSTGVPLCCHSVSSSVNFIAGCMAPASVSRAVQSLTIAEALRYFQVIHRTHMPHVGDELHHSGMSHCPEAMHPAMLGSLQILHIAAALMLKLCGIKHGQSLLAQSTFSPSRWHAWQRHTLYGGIGLCRFSTIGCAMRLKCS